jgi:sec-independent protein translocase protein TatA
MPTLGPTELIIILVIVIILFGVGRISKIAGEMGSGVRAFRDAVKEEEDEDEGEEKKEEKEDKKETDNT